jgi:hypothetical protein
VIARDPLLFGALIAGGLGVCYLVTSFVVWPLLRPHGTHHQHRQPAKDWDGEDLADEQWATKLASLRHQLTAQGQAAQLRIRAEVVGRLIISARQARAAWGLPDAHTAPPARPVYGTADVVRDMVVRSTLLGIEAEAARSRAEAAAQAAADRPWEDETGSFAAVKAGDQS